MDILGQEIDNYASEILSREEKIHELSSEISKKYRYHSIIGSSRAMQNVYKSLEKVSKTDATVLINGENGTGKELLAKAVHYTSLRKERAFLSINCSAFNDNLLDSELFGHVKGAFTGAIREKAGLFEMANEGTLFLDEIGDMSPAMQVKILRVLQERTYIPVGGNVVKTCDVRIIAATNKNLLQLINSGKFREDLFYRVNVIPIVIPPLRERQEDIPILAKYFLEKKCGELGIPVKTFGKRVLEKFLNYEWPGNVRELENEIEKMIILTEDERNITSEHVNLNFEISQNYYWQERGVNTASTLKKAIDDLEFSMISEGLKRCNFNKSKLAKELDISRASLISKVIKFGLDKKKGSLKIA